MSKIKKLKFFVELFTVIYKSSYNKICTINNNKVSHLYYSYWTAKELTKKI